MSLLCLGAGKSSEKETKVKKKYKQDETTLKRESFEKSSITSEDSDMLIQNKDDFKALFGN